MANRRTAYYYMTAAERKEYHRIKAHEYNERKAILRGYPLRTYNKNANLATMTREERLAYNRECLRRHKERQKTHHYEGEI